MQRLLHRQVGSRAGKTQFYTEYLSKLLNIQAKVKSNSACDDLYKNGAQIWRDHRQVGQDHPFRTVA
jgi:hypothetical protein